MADAGAPGDAPERAAAGESVGDVANLFLGNVLYAIERCALALQDEGKAEDAAFYRAIGRRLAEARGRERAGPR